MSTTYVCSQSMAAVTCARCGVLFGMPEHWTDQFKKTHREFYCPAGHSQFFPAETGEEKLRKEVARLQTDQERKEAIIQRKEEIIQGLDKSLSCAKGQVTRIRNRVQAGVCPRCNRTFTNLARHMAHKHPV